MYGGGYGGLDNFGKRQFSYRRTRGADKISHCASLFYLNALFEASFFHAEHLTASEKYKFSRQKYIIREFYEVKLVSKSLICDAGTQALRHKMQSEVSGTSTQFGKYEFGTQETNVSEFCFAKLGKQGFALRHKVLSEASDGFTATDKLLSEASDGFTVTDNVLSEVSDDFTATDGIQSEVSDSLTANDKTLSEASDGFTATDKVLSEASDGLPATDNALFEVSDTSTALDKYKFFKQENIVCEYVMREFRAVHIITQKKEFL